MARSLLRPSKMQASGEDLLLLLLLLLLYWRI
jgi:hypothetical protein